MPTCHPLFTLPDCAEDALVAKEVDAVYPDSYKFYSNFTNSPSCPRTKRKLQPRWQGTCVIWAMKFLSTSAEPAWLPSSGTAMGLPSCCHRTRCASRANHHGAEQANLARYADGHRSARRGDDCGCQENDR